MWGCETENELPVEVLACVRCNGEGMLTEIEECAKCKGSGELVLFRCPNAIVDPSADALCRTAALIESGISPCPGMAWSDMPAALERSLSFIASERSFYEGKRQQHEEEKQRMASRRGRNG